MQYTHKKHLGQHFLKDENICRKIVEQLKPGTFKNLLEVGPGAGAITKYLVQLPGVNFKAVELDAEKVEYLLHSYPQLNDKIIHKSFLEIEAPFGEEFTVIGNFPYNISSQILFKILEWKQQVPEVIGMFQKEVAQRIASKPGSKAYGILSVLVQAYYEVEYLFDVSENCFIPPPKVKSGVIRLQRLVDPVTAASDAKFFQLVKLAFNQRRKMLRNGLRSVFPEDELKDEIFSKRAEQLSVNDFAQLTFRMK